MIWAVVYGELAANVWIALFVRRWLFRILTQSNSRVFPHLLTLCQVGRWDPRKHWWSHFKILIVFWQPVHLNPYLLFIWILKLVRYQIYQNLVNDIWIEHQSPGKFITHIPVNIYFFVIQLQFRIEKHHHLSQNFFKTLRLCLDWPLKIKMAFRVFEKPTKELGRLGTS